MSRDILYTLNHTLLHTYLAFQFFCFVRSTTTNANKHPRQTRPNLAPLKMPDKRRTPSLIDKVDTPPSTGNSTPATATPGSAGSATTSPQWSLPGNLNNPRSPSPLTVIYIYIDICRKVSFNILSAQNLCSLK